VRRDRGQAALEYLGMLPFLLLIALAGIQLGIAAYCGSQAGTAARTAARTAAESGPDGGLDAATRAGENAVSGWVNPDIRYPATDAEKVTAQASVHIPSVVPGLHLFDPVSRTATMPKEDWTP
jgi:Flp pilus assembly protein TadG